VRPVAPVLLLLFGLVLVGTAPARAGEDAGAEFVAPTLRLVHLVDGLRSQPKNRDLLHTQETKIYKTAKAAGVDLGQPARLEHPLVVAHFEKNRLFYLFYKIAERAVGDRPYLIQRIKKTERTWATDDQEEPEVRTTYQVEVFKTFAGALKRADQHHGSYGLGDRARREIVKEYEIGFGEIPGTCEGTAWPFGGGRLFQYVQPFQEEPGIYPEVRFFAATPWTLAVSLASDGTYAVRCPELGIDAPARLPDPQSARPQSDPTSKDVVLLAGQGPEGLVLGKSRLEDLVARLGEPLQSQTWSSGSANHWFGRGLVFNLKPDGTLNTLMTRPSFSGCTGAGIRHGDPRHRVLEVMGMPKPAMTNAWAWSYPEGVLFYFDGYDRVSQIVVFAR